MRLLLITIMCANDINEASQLIDVMKELHKDKFDAGFVEGIMRKRAEIEANA